MEVIIVGKKILEKMKNDILNQSEVDLENDYGYEAHDDWSWSDH